MINIINLIAQTWWNWMSGMFWQVSLLIVLIFVIDVLIRKWVWPQVRYALWLVVLIKLILPPTFSVPTSISSQVLPFFENYFTTQVLQNSAGLNTDNSILQNNSFSNRQLTTFPADDKNSQVGQMNTPTNETNKLSPQILTNFRNLTWQVLMLGLWIVGTLFLVAGLIIRLKRLYKSHNQLTERYFLPDWFPTLLTQCANQLKLRQVPEVILSDKIVCLAVFGILRPRLLLPVYFLKNLTPKQTKYILLHELAHIKRGDLLTYGLQILLLVIYWFNPLLWFAKKQMQHLRELCCDATVAKHLQKKTSDYRQTLLVIARQLLTQSLEPGLGFLGLFEESHHLVSRLNWLKKGNYRYNWLKILTAYLIIILMLVAVLPMTKAENRDYEYKNHTQSPSDTLASSNDKYEVIPEIITIETKKVKGFGPFGHSISPLFKSEVDDPWKAAIPKINGLPDTLERMTIVTQQMDMLQHLYQSYYQGKISKEWFDSCLKSWQFDTSMVTKDFVKLSVGFAAGFDERGRAVVYLDRNNNYDLSDEKPVFLPAASDGKEFWSSYDDSQLVEIEYEYFDKNGIKKASTWLYVNQFPSDHFLTKRFNDQIVLAISIAEHRVGEFSINNQVYKIAFCSSHGTYRENCWAYLSPNKKNVKRTPPDMIKNRVRKGKIITIGNYHYRFLNTSIDGKFVTLVRDELEFASGGTQIGQKASNFTAQTISGEVITLNELRGKYIYLNFYWTSSKPFKTEIPKLKAIYDNFKKNKLEMIGFFIGQTEQVKSFVQEHQIKWPQIQLKKASAIKLYDINKMIGYPNTYLIGPDGLILDKRIQAEELEMKLNSLLLNEKRGKL